MMLFGSRILLKFLSGRVLGLTSGQHSFEYRQLLARLEAPDGGLAFWTGPPSPRARHLRARPDRRFRPSVCPKT
jgi:hypothetical protein